MISSDDGINAAGGVLIADGSSGMAQAPSTDSVQNSIVMTYSSTQAEGTIVNFKVSDTVTALNDSGVTTIVEGGMPGGSGKGAPGGHGNQKPTRN